MGPVIAVVDDDPAFCKLLSDSLTGAGYLVVLATTGSRAYRLIQQARPALAILDLMLPGVNGLVLCKTLQAEAQIPVIMLTARSSEEEVVEALQLGAFDHIAKPFSVPVLMQRVRQAMGP